MWPKERLWGGGRVRGEPLGEECAEGSGERVVSEGRRWDLDPAAVATPGSTTGTDSHLKPSESRPAQPGTLIPSAQRLVWAAKQPLGNAALGALFA